MYYYAGDSGSLSYFPKRGDYSGCKIEKQLSHSSRSKRTFHVRSFRLAPAAPAWTNSPRVSKWRPPSNSPASPSAGKPSRFASSSPDNWSSSKLSRPGTCVRVCVLYIWRVYVRECCCVRACVHMIPICYHEKNVTKSTNPLSGLGIASIIAMRVSAEALHVRGGPAKKDLVDSRGRPCSAKF